MLIQAVNQLFQKAFSQDSVKNLLLTALRISALFILCPPNWYELCLQEINQMFCVKNYILTQDQNSFFTQIGLVFCKSMLQVSILKYIFHPDANKIAVILKYVHKYLHVLYLLIQLRQSQWKQAFIQKQIKYPTL